MSRETYTNIEAVPGFQPEHGKKRRTLLIPSQGEHGTKILVGQEGEMLYEQRSASHVTGPNPGIMVSRIPLPASERTYRQTVFGEQNPRWVVPTKPFEPGVPLDQIILADERFLTKIKNAVGEHFGDQAPTLSGFHQTTEMERITELLDLSYYGNAEFAAKAGSKIGLQKFTKECGVPTPLTFAIHDKKNLEQQAAALKDAGYTHLAIKINHSTGAIGQNVFEIDLLQKQINISGVEHAFPPEYSQTEGGVVQGFIPEAVSTSLGIFVDFDGSYVFEAAQQQTIGDHYDSKGAQPLPAKYLDKMINVGHKLARGYVKHKAWGHHTMDMIFIPEHVSNRLKLPPGEPLCHDENTRPGANTIAKDWILALREKLGIGWYVSKINVPQGTDFETVLKTLDAEGLLIKAASNDAHGIFPYNGAVLDTGSENAFYAIGLSKNDDPHEAEFFIHQAANVLKN